MSQSELRRLAGSCYGKPTTTAMRRVGIRFLISCRHLVNTSVEQGTRVWGSISGEFIVTFRDHTPRGSLEHRQYGDAKVGQRSYYSCYCPYS